MEWRQVLKGGGIFLGVTVILFIFSAFVLMAFLNPNGGMPAPTGANADLQKGMRTVLLFLIAAGLLGLSGWLAYKLMPGRALKVVALTFAVLLLGYGTRSMVLSSFQYGDVPVEMLVYTQSSRDVPIVADLIKRLSRDETAFEGRGPNDVTGGRSLEISIDQAEAITWPFDWYFRDMKNYKYFHADNWKALQAGQPQNIVSPNVAVILASELTESQPSFQEFIKDKYTTQRYVLNWWFPEDAYKKTNPETGVQAGDMGTAWNWMMGNLGKYILYRNPGLPLGSRNFYLHVRNDLAEKAGLLSAGAPTGQTGNNPPPVDPNAPVSGMFDLKQGSNRGEFNLPRGIARDSIGNFYVVDTSNFRVQKFDPTGKFVSLIGNGRGSGDGQVNPLVLDSGDAPGTGPGGVAVDGDGNIYVADTWNHRVLKFGPAGNFLRSWGSFIDLGDPNSVSDQAKDSKFYGPRGVAVGPGDTIYVTDTGNKRVLVFNKDGQYQKQITSGLTPQRRQDNYPFTQPGEMNEPIGVAVDKSGNVYVADSRNNRIQKFDSTGKNVGTWAITGGGWGEGPYLEPFLALDEAGTSLYATAPTGKKVLKYDTATGQMTGEKASEGAISLKLPTGITVAPDGTIYVVDTNGPGVVSLGKMP
jgi:DNA-binding beta-propeller fold protein YncE